MLHLYKDPGDFEPKKCKRCGAYFMEKKILNHHIFNMHSVNSKYKKPTLDDIRKLARKKNTLANTLANTVQNMNKKSSMKEKLRPPLKMNKFLKMGKFRRFSNF